MAGYPSCWLSRAAGLIIVGCCCALNLDVSAQATKPARATFQRSLEDAQAEFARQLEDIAKYCDEHKLTFEAEEIRKLKVPLPPNVLQGENLPRQVQAEIPKDLPEVEKSWRTKLRTLQKEYAENLFAKARVALDDGRIRVAYDLVREVARHNPDHKFSRRLLGYTQSGNEWVTFFADKKLKQKQVLTEKYGWLKPDQVERYKAGERFYDNRWMTALKEAELRRDFAHAWVVQTDHYKIVTNHSLEMGVELGRHLEDFYRIFFQTFAGFLTSRTELKRLFKDGSSSGGAVIAPFEVHYYRTKQEYVVRLQPKFTQSVEGTSGLYLSGNRAQPEECIAHFYHNEDVSSEERLATMFHEATHQLFAEAYTSNPKIGVDSDFWVIEAIACYMESFQRQGESFSLGNPKYIRFQNAQIRLLVDQYYVPLQQLCGMGMQTFQSDPKISMNYSQGAGLAHFFMHYQNGLYRDEFIDYLSDIYSKNPKVRANPRSLAELTDVEFGKLDQQYRDYMTELKTGVRLDRLQPAVAP